MLVLQSSRHEGHFRDSLLGKQRRSTVSDGRKEPNVGVVRLEVEEEKTDIKRETGREFPVKTNVIPGESIRFY